MTSKILSEEIISCLEDVFVVLLLSVCLFLFLCFPLMPGFKSQERVRLPTKLETLSDHPKIKVMQLRMGIQKNTA